MRFSFALATTLFAIMFSATNAASIMMKRAAPNVESCVKSINDISLQIDALQPTIINGGIIDTSREYNDLEGDIRAARSSCCAINSPISDADADYFLAAYGNTTPKVQSLLSTITQKAHDYNFITRGIIEVRIKNLNDDTNNLNTCLTVFTPASKASALQENINKINDAFTSARATFDLF